MHKHPTYCFKFAHVLGHCTVCVSMDHSFWSDRFDTITQLVKYIATNIKQSIFNKLLMNLLRILREQLACEHMELKGSLRYEKAFLDLLTF